MLILFPSLTYVTLGFPSFLIHSLAFREKKLAKVQHFFDIHKYFLKKIHFFVFFLHFAIFILCFRLGHRRFSPSLSALCVRTIRPSRPSYPRHTSPRIPLSVRPRKMPSRPLGLNAGVAHAACSFSMCR